MRDTGTGIPVADLALIFWLFYQTRAGAVQGEGTASGLAVCRAHARLMRGEIMVESVPDRGSIFHPRLTLALATAKEATEGLGQGARLTPGQPRYRVLVAEDRPDNQRLIGQVLTQAGFAVRCVDNGKAAITAF